MTIYEKIAALPTHKKKREKLLILSEKVHIFIHYSLHTYEHTKLEYETLLDLNKRHSLVFMCDNLEMESGVFFEEFKLKNQNYRFTNLGISVPS